jgi:hypothetical protein
MTRGFLRSARSAKNPVFRAHTRFYLSIYFFMQYAYKVKNNAHLSQLTKHLPSTTSRTVTTHPLNFKPPLLNHSSTK